MRVLFLLLFVLTLISVVVPFAATALTLPTGAPVISIEEARDKVGNPDVIFIDVRSPVHWGPSDAKIPGARREEPKKPESWLLSYPRDKTIILYCA